MLILGCRVLYKLLARPSVSFASSESHHWTDVVISLVDEFPQLFQQLRSEPSLLSQLPVYKLGGEGGLHHPLWFEKASGKGLEEDYVLPDGSDGDEDNDESEFDRVEENNDFFVFNTDDPSLPPIYVLPDQVQLETRAGKVEEGKGPVTTEVASILLSDDWETIDKAEEQNSVVDSPPVAETAMVDKEPNLELLEAASKSITEESVTPELGTAGRTGAGKIAFVMFS